MTQRNTNAYLHDLSEHLTVEIQPRERRNLVALCACGWRTPLSKKPSVAMRLYWQMHMRPLEEEVDATRCPNCFRRTADGQLCDECRTLELIYGKK